MFPEAKTLDWRLLSVKRKKDEHIIELIKELLEQAPPCFSKMPPTASGKIKRTNETKRNSIDLIQKKLNDMLDVKQSVPLLLGQYCEYQFLKKDASQTKY